MRFGSIIIVFAAFMVVCCASSLIRPNEKSTKSLSSNVFNGQGEDSKFIPKIFSLRGGKTIVKTKKGHAASSKPKTTKRELTKDDESRIISRQKTIMQIEGTIISFGSMYLSRKIMTWDYKTPSNLKLARLIFVSYLVFAQLLYFVLKFLIKWENNKDLVIQQKNPLLSSPLLSGNPMMKMLEGFGGSKKTDVPLTVKQYDLQQNKDLYKSLLMEIIGVTFLHSVFKMGAPLLMVPMWGITNRLKSPLIQIRLFGMKPLGQFARPFKSQMELMMDDMGSGFSASIGLEKDEDAVPSSPVEKVTNANITDVNVETEELDSSLTDSLEDLNASVDPVHDQDTDDIQIEESEQETIVNVAPAAETVVKSTTVTSVSTKPEPSATVESSARPKKSMKSRELAKKLEAKMNEILDDLIVEDLDCFNSDSK